MNKLINLDNSIAIFLKPKLVTSDFQCILSSQFTGTSLGMVTNNSGFSWCVFMPLNLKVYSNLRQWIEVTEKEKVGNKPTSLCILSQLHLTSRGSKFPEWSNFNSQFYYFKYTHTCFAPHCHTYYRYISIVYLPCILWISIHIYLFSTLCLMWVLDGVHF